jgi:homoserine dehydrogenase
VRYVGSGEFQSKQVRVGLEDFKKSHPVTVLRGTDNAISFRTKRYGARPLIIQGASAGAEVPAMGTTGDLVKDHKRSP